jgi:hypothetical protein
VPAPSQLFGDGKGGKHVPAGAAAGHQKCHPECSLTLSRIPREIRLLSRELPP